MEFKTILFYLFSTITVLAALRVITARNPVHAVLFLVLAFFNVAGLWLLLQAEFLALALVAVAQPASIWRCRCSRLRLRRGQTLG